MSPPQDLVAIFHASFHPTKGNIIDWSLKASPDVNLTNLEFNTLPSGLHQVESDVVYFTSPHIAASLHTGISIFRRRPTTQHGHRGFLLSSLGVLLAPSERPRPWRHLNALKELYARPAFDASNATTEADLLELGEDDRWREAEKWFEERKAREKDLGGAGSWSGWSSELLEIDQDCPTRHLPHLLAILGPSSLTLYKHVVGRKRVLIYTRPPQKVEAASILTFVASELGDGWDDETELHSTASVSSTTARHRRRPIPVLGLITLNDMDRLEAGAARGWVACTTDAIFLEKPNCYDLLVDLTTVSPGTSLRPTFYATRAVDLGAGRKEWKKSVIRFTWSDVQIWTEVDRLLTLGSHSARTTAPCCMSYPGAKHHHPNSKMAWAWMDMWRVYEDVCVMCAGLWMGSVWKSSSPSPGVASSEGGRQQASAEGESGAGALIDLDHGEGDGTALGTMRNLGLGIEGRPNVEGLNTKEMGRSSGMTWKGRKERDKAKTGPEAPTVEPADAAEDDRDAITEAHEREAMTTLALLQTFHMNTAWQVARLQDLIAASPPTSDTDTVLRLLPKDVLSFDLGPFSSLDAKFLEWLAEQYGDGRTIVVRRGWKELMSFVLGWSA